MLQQYVSIERFFPIAWWPKIDELDTTLFVSWRRSLEFKKVPL